MPMSYPGNPAGAGTTIPVPGPRTIPQGRLPVDGDPVTADSVDEAHETELDWLAFLNVGGALGDALGGAATSFDGSSAPATWNDMLTTDGAPISGLDVLPTFVAASAFNVTIGAGSGYLNTSVGIGPGESAYRTIYWASQAVAHATPHATLDRIDAVAVTPAAFGTASVLAVVTGTPAATPLAPANPAGSGVLFYVMVPAAVADATHFRACRGLWRRVGYPWSGMSAIVAGLELGWDYTADPSAASAVMTVGDADQVSLNITINRILIDGEMLEWAGYGNSSLSSVVEDSTANPFGSAASSSFDTPYYVYACGGRHNPLPVTHSNHAFLLPVTFCESTVPPNPKTGKPTGNLTVNGVTVTPNGAVYIGLGFVAAGSTNRRGCLMDGEMTYSFNPMQQFVHTFSGSGREDAGSFTGGCQPAISTKMAIGLLGLPQSGIGTTFALWLADFPVPTTPFTPFTQGLSFATPGIVAPMYATLSFTTRVGAELWVQSIPLTGTAYGSLAIGARGFDHRVRRLIAGY
jgi:hypothetical protein